MSKLAIKRISQEITEIKNGGKEMCEIKTLNEQNLFINYFTLIGPSETPYENGKFHFLVEFPSNYPFSPPNITLKTPIYHLNHKNGKFCLDILLDNWNPSLTLYKIILSFQSLLMDPNPYDSLNSSLANEYINDKILFNSIAKEWTLLYASSPLSSLLDYDSNNDNNYNSDKRM